MRSAFSYGAFYATCGYAQAVASAALAQVNQDLGIETLSVAAQPIKLKRSGSSVSLFIQDPLQKCSSGALTDQLARFRGVFTSRIGGLGQIDHGFAISRTRVQCGYPSAFAADSDRGEHTTRNLYAKALWAAHPDLDLSLALRRDDHDRFSGQTSGQMAGAWWLNETWIFRAFASTGFHATPLYELYSSYGNRDLRPETSRSYGLGADYIWGEGRSLPAPLFGTKINNKISYAHNRDEQLAGVTRTPGLDVVGNYKQSSDWQIFGKYTYTDAFAENFSLEVRHHDLSMGLTAASGDQFTALAALHHIADFSDNGVWPAPASRVPDYTVDNVSLGSG